MIRWIVALVFTALAATSASAMEVKQITSSGGIQAWLVESRTIPLIAMNFSFEGGSINDPRGKEGAVHFITGMMDEGAGDLDSAAFQARRDELAVKMSFDEGPDRFEGTLQTLSKNRDEAFLLLKKSLTAPRFEATAMERVRQQFLVAAAEEAEDPGKIAMQNWLKLAYPGHPYSRNGHGTVDSIAAITPEDLKSLHKLIFTRQGLKIVVVGDIDAETLSRQLDLVFGDLPDTPSPPPAPVVKVAEGPAQTVTEREIPQTLIYFGSNGLLRSDPDFIPAFVMTHILGGGAFSSYLSKEVREKRGLTYGISMELDPMQSSGMLIGTMSTSNDKVAEAMSIVKDTLKRMAEQGPTAGELKLAQTYLTGSYALRFDSNTKIAAQLLKMWQFGLEPDYINTRNAKIEAVTPEQVKAQAQRLVHPDKMIITYIGQPNLGDDSKK